MKIIITKIVEKSLYLKNKTEYSVNLTVLVVFSYYSQELEKFGHFRVLKGKRITLSKEDRGKMSIKWKLLNIS